MHYYHSQQTDKTKENIFYKDIFLIFLYFLGILSVTERNVIQMVEQDTVKLLRECDAGVKMGIDSIEKVMPYVKNSQFKNALNDCKDQHNELDREIQELLDKYHDEGKDPAVIAKGMSMIKTNVMLAMDTSDNTVADLMTDGCNMGVKSLNKYLNQYSAADEVSKDIAKRLINMEEKLAVDIRSYL